MPIIISVVAVVCASGAALTGLGSNLDRQGGSNLDRQGAVTGKIDLQVDRFLVRSRNVASLHRELKRRNRTDSSGAWRYGVTTWRILEKPEQRLLEIKVSYPISLRAQSDKFLNKVLKNIRGHELQHSAICRNAFLATLSESKFKSAESIFRLNTEFDRRTQHGDVLSRRLRSNS